MRHYLWNYIGVKYLAGVLFFVIAFQQGDARQITAACLMTVFCAYNLAVYFRRRWLSNAKKKVETPQQQCQTEPVPTAVPKPAVSPNPAQQILPVDYRVIMLRHINFRITEKLRASGYADATWSWCCRAPLDVALRNGTARIRTFETGDKNFAEVTFLPSGKIKIALLQIESLDQPQSNNESETGKSSEPMELSSWYEVNASSKLRKIIDEIAACGNRKLFLDESGSAYVVQNGKKSVQGKIESMPDRSRWKELIPLFADDDITAAEGKDALALTWD